MFKVWFSTSKMYPLIKNIKTEASPVLSSMPHLQLSMNVHVIYECFFRGILDFLYPKINKQRILSYNSQQINTEFPKFFMPGQDSNSDLLFPRQLDDHLVTPRGETPTYIGRYIFLYYWMAPIFKRESFPTRRKPDRCPFSWRPYRPGTKKHLL
jgi:hypothetical protein